MDSNYFKEKYIKSINSEDINVALSGVVINKEDNSFVLDDGTSQILVYSNIELNGDFVRVFGKINYNGEEPQLQAFIVQDLSKVDKFLYKKVKDLMYG